MPKLEILFPEISGLFGDAMNCEILRRALPDAEIIKTSLADRPAFTQAGADMVILGAMTERAQELAINALMHYYSNIKTGIESGTVFLITGNAVEIFGNYIENDDGSKICALGIFDFYAKRQMLKRSNAIYLGEFRDMDIVGFKSQFAHIYGGESVPPLFSTTRGSGRNPTDVNEGFLENNFMATSLIGPLLALNPLFLRHTLNLLGAPDCTIPFESAAISAYNTRLREFQNPQTLVEF